MTDDYVDVDVGIEVKKAKRIDFDSLDIGKIYEFIKINPDMQVRRAIRICMGTDIWYFKEDVDKLFKIIRQLIIDDGLL